MDKTDVLIIGSGGAGCAAAIEAVKSQNHITMITAGDFLLSKTSRAQGGIQAAYGLNDSIHNHYLDTLKAGEYENNKKLVEILTKKAPATIEWLENLGVVFDKTEDGSYKLQNAGGLSHPRILSCGEKSGNRLMSPLQKRVYETNAIVLEHIKAVSIVRSNQGFQVELMNTQNGTSRKLATKAIVFATGGIMPEGKKSGLKSSDNSNTPDAFQVASAYGVEIVYPDLIQYHPTGIILPKELRRERIPETIRSAGANLLNKDLEAFCDPLLTRNKLTELIIKECTDSKGVTTDDGRTGVWLNTPKVDELNGKGFLENNFPTLYNDFYKYGIKLNEEMVLIYPILHYSLGGIKIDENAQTNVEGIFAAGEAAFGVHGKDRLMGNSLLDIFVFGRLAGTKAATYASTIKDIKQ